jgi:hypothetical protein
LSRYELSFNDDLGSSPIELSGQSFEVGRVGRAIQFDSTGFIRYEAAGAIDEDAPTSDPSSSCSTTRAIRSTRPT